MNLLKITSAYDSYLQYFYKRNKIAKKTFAEQKIDLEYDEFCWYGVWEKVLAPLGYDVLEIIYNADPLQMAWASENGLKNKDLVNIAVEQAKRFKPDILWFDDINAQLLKQIKLEVPSIRCVFGWVGSAIAKTEVWKDIDVVLSCAPESVQKFKNEGIRSEHLNHAFDARINTKLKDNDTIADLSFFGQIIRGSQFHLERERILLELVKQIKVKIYSPSAEYTLKDTIKSLLKIGAYDFAGLLGKVGDSSKFLSTVPFIRKVYSWSERPMLPINHKLKPYIYKPLYGVDMFQAIKDSSICLNIHADSSPQYASNMRLYEITGVGTCMVADYKKNIGELFEVDKEIVTYKTPEECIDKVKWLINNPKEREKIALAGQSRTLRDHTFEKRAVQLDNIIRKEILRCWVLLMILKR